jgi:hypothetical protein
MAITVYVRRKYSGKQTSKVKDTMKLNHNPQENANGPGNHQQQTKSTPYPVRFHHGQKCASM